MTSKGVNKGGRLSLRAMRRSAEHGDAKAQCDLGVRSLDEKKAEDAVRWFRKAAEQGHAGAQHNLAVFCLSEGIGCEKDEKQAFGWLLKAAKQEMAQVQLELGQRSEHGIGTPKDERAAAGWYRKAAEQGHYQAQYNLGVFLENGVGVSKDLGQAFSWYFKSALQGCAAAQHNLSVCFLHGFGTEKNHPQALYWTRQAAKRGDPHALYNLSVWHTDGTGVGKDDHQKAAKLLEKARAAGNQLSELSLLSLQDKEPHSSLSLARAEVCPIEPHELHNERTLSPSAFGQAVLCTFTRFGKQRLVVVKVPLEAKVPVGKSPQQTALSPLFKSEWLAMSALPKHPNVIELVGLCQGFECAGRETGKQLKAPVSFVSEFYANGSVADYFAKPEHKGNSAKHLISWAADIARGMAHLHAHNVVHRDLFARNVFIANDMRAVVGDLGLAQAIDNTTGVYVGDKQSKVRYPLDTDPRAAMQHKYTAQTDVFTLGVTLFEIATECKYSDTLLLTWNTSSKNDEEAMEKFARSVAAGVPELMTKLPSTVRIEIQFLMKRCMEFEPSKRPSAAGVAAELEELLSTSKPDELSRRD